MSEMESKRLCVSPSVISRESQRDAHDDQSETESKADAGDDNINAPTNHDNCNQDEKLKQTIESKNRVQPDTATERKSVKILQDQDENHESEDDNKDENRNTNNGDVHSVRNGSKPRRIHFCEEEDNIRKVFDEFDENSDDLLDKEEFSAFLQAVFHNQNMTSIPKEKREEFMKLLDSNKDGVIDFGEFKHAWSHCFRKVLKPVTAIVIVDVQNDFIDGTLALKHCPAKQDGAEIVPVINKLIAEGKYDLVVYSIDWHPDNHISFVNNVDKYPVDAACATRKGSSSWATYDDVEFDLSPPRTQTLWPPHCIQGSDGAKLHKDLIVAEDSVNIYKGTKADIDSYSAFFDNMKLSHTAMQQELKRKNITDVYICGLAYDICVAATSRDAVGLGYRTVVVDDACRGVKEENITAAKEQLTELGALICHSDEVIKLVNKEDCSFDLALFAAKTMPAAETTTVASPAS